jgi:hypothetical protein
LRKQARAEHRSVSGLVVYVLDTYARANDLFEKHKPPPRLQKAFARRQEDVDE